MSDPMRESDGRRFISTRPDGRHLSTAAGVFSSWSRTPPTLEYRHDTTVEAHHAWAEQLRKRLAELLHVSDLPVPEAHRTSSKQRDGYTLERWELTAGPDTVVPFLLLLPDAAENGPVPLVLCAPGTDHGKELLAGEPEVHGTPNNPTAHWPERNRMAWWYVRKGWAAICIDNPATREREAADGPGRTDLCVTLIAMGSSYLEESVHTWRLALRWARGLDWVDRDRIAVSGHSLGTGPTLSLAVLDPAIRAVVLNTNLHGVRDRMLATGLDPMPLWHYVPGMLAAMDRPDLVCALAPRPVLIAEGATEEARLKVESAYGLLDAGQEARFAYFDEMPRDSSLTDIPEGITFDRFKHFARLYSAKHYFKPDLAIPFLDHAFSD